jgi:hypothetical protein
VKFIVPSRTIDHEHLKDALRDMSQAEEYAFVFVDAARTKVHMIDRVFHEIARQVDWDQLAFSFLSRSLPQHGYKCPPGREDFCLAKIAELNERDQGLLSGELKSLLEKNLWHDYRMCQEYRLAMIRLCQAVLDPGNVRPRIDVVKSWLIGELRLISEMKPALIFQKIARHNARHMLASLSHWMHCAGKSGLVIVLDIGRCLEQRPRPIDPGDDSLYYTKATTLDAYEVLRECIDATDEMEYCVIVVIAPLSFLQPDGRRSVWRYDALKLRIWDEVRDEHRANPLSPLVRLAHLDEVQQ